MRDKCRSRPHSSRSNRELEQTIPGEARDGYVTSEILQCRYTLHRAPDVIMKHEHELRVQQLLDNANGKKVLRRSPVNPVLTTAEKIKKKKREEKTRQFILIMVFLILLFATAYNEGVTDGFTALFSAG